MTILQLLAKNLMASIYGSLACRFQISFLFCFVTFDSFAVTLLSDVIKKSVKNFSVSSRCSKWLHVFEQRTRHRIPLQNVGYPIKIFVQIEPAIQVLRGIKVLVTSMGGHGASTFLYAFQATF